MNAKKNRGDVLRALCARDEDEDGVRPERRREKARPTGRKDLQLCKQVMWAVQGALSAGGDPVLRELMVVAVEPAPNAGRLRVAVGAASGESAEAIGNALERAKPYLRAEVAGVISRKRAPELVFAVVPIQEGNDAE
jgi:ribosome-binding factor A